MIDALLAPLRLPERALDAVSRIARDLAALREETADGLGTLAETTASLAGDLRPLRTDVAVVRESTSSLPEGIAKLEKAVDGLSG